MKLKTSIILLLIVSLVSVTSYFIYHSFAVSHSDRNFIQSESPKKKLVSKSNKLINSVPSNKSLGYQSLTQEVSISSLTIKGSIPSWLSGTLFRNGPAQFALKEKRFGNWFDGFAMMHRFSFNNGKVSYANKFLESTYYQRACKTGKLPLGTSDKEKPKSLFSKFGSLFAKAPVYDNTNVHVTTINNQFVALTESTYALAFDPHTLKTKGPVSYEDQLEGHVSTAHPITDPKSDESFNILTQLGNTSYYQVYKINKNSNQRNLITSIPAKQPSYIHSFALSKNYIVLTMIPFVLNPLDALFSNKPFLHNFKWKPEQGTKFIIINRNSGKLIGTYKTDAFFVFHHVNAFEKNNEISIDLVAHQNESIVYQMGLKKLCCTNESKPGTLKRFTINLATAQVTQKELCKIKLESPRINEHYLTHQNNFIYAVSSDDRQIIKIAIDHKKPLIWQEDNCYPSEAIFVAKPNGKHEDDGVILSTVLDTQTKKSFLLILNAKTMKEIGRAIVPHHIPFGFHGNFYNK